MNILGVAVFSGEGCAGCVTVKALLDSLGVSYLPKDINKSEVMEQAAQLGIRSIPVTMFCFDNGTEELVVGSSKEALARIKDIVS